ncbi:MAG: 1-acyl-sn-glycerol-3-phosphate acyltransferase [Mycolicibacterium sp.]|nr:1-acyl-sn-glycerol-3-phosphate acyltransferase [Mycolicibacterium sp.]
MAEPVFRTLESIAKIAVAAAGTKITYYDLDYIPPHGGAVAAINHTSYIDWLPAALAAHYRHRRIRFMIKEEMRRVRIINFLIKHTGTIPVNRSAGAQAYAIAVERLKTGELVGVYPEATISRSFELKEFKSGAARMARESNMPIVPIIVWGAQRIWTKDHPKNLGRSKIPMTVRVGPPLYADDSVERTNTALRASMTALLRQAQQEYPHPIGAFWVPRRMGGSAPTLPEAKALDEAELAERARRRAERA